MEKRFLAGMFFACLCALLVGLYGCSSGSSSASGTTEGTTETETTIDDNTTLLANVPSGDPTALDYSTASVSASISRNIAKAFVKQGFGEEDEGDGTGIRLKIVGGGFGNVSIYQCQDGTQIGYAAYTFDSATSTYSGSMQMSWMSMISSIEISIPTLDLTDESFLASATLRNQNMNITIGADGATDSNNFSAVDSYGNAFASHYDGDEACAGFRVFGDNNSTVEVTDVPMNFTVGSDRSRTFADTNDPSLCLDVPDFPTHSFITELSGTWDCSMPDGASLIEISQSASALEDAGGGDCVTLNDFWEDAESPLDGCSNEADANSTSCFFDYMYSQGVQAVRFAERFLLCKIKGVFALVESGTITDVTLGDDSTIYLHLQGGLGIGE